MKSKFFAALVLATLATASFAADVTGKWTAEVAGRNGQTRTTNFDFKVEGEKLTGSMSGMQGGDMPIVDGTAKGDDIAFNVVVNFNGNEMKMVFKGKVAGDVIKMSRTREGAEGPAQEFEAKRVK
jgi:opacity protein-like surface antigen